MIFLKGFWPPVSELESVWQTPTTDLGLKPRQPTLGAASREEEGSWSILSPQRGRAGSENGAVDQDKGRQMLQLGYYILGSVLAAVCAWSTSSGK